MITEMYRLNNGEETRGLLAETWNAVLLDSRAAETALSLRPHEERDPNRSENENAMRIWRPLIPDDHTEWLEFRMAYGWTKDEIREIASLIAAVYNEFGRLTENVPLDGTRETLIRTLGYIQALYHRWLDIIGERASIEDMAPSMEASP